MTNVNLILGVLAAIGVGVMVLGNILMDGTLWIIFDVYHGALFVLIAVRLISLRNTKKLSK